MKNELEDLIKKFEYIKGKELITSLRKGTTGLGYTFETMIGKKEDKNYLPDYKGIEIKTKLGYTKDPITLFTLVPQMKEKPPIKFLIENFGYYTVNNKNQKKLRANVFYNKTNIVGNKYIFKLKLENNNKILRLYILNLDYTLINNDVYWSLDDIINRLKIKLNYLAIIKGYPYKINNKTFYKYTNMNIYKLEKTQEFITLIMKDQIYITFNIEIISSGDKIGKIHDRGTAFKLSQNYINYLFKKIY